MIKGEGCASSHRKVLRQSLVEAKPWSAATVTHGGGICSVQDFDGGKEKKKTCMSAVVIVGEVDYRGVLSTCVVSERGVPHFSVFNFID